jgi:hypothetical protein
VTGIFKFQLFTASVLGAGSAIATQVSLTTAPADCPLDVTDPSPWATPDARLVPALDVATHMGAAGQPSVLFRGRLLPHGILVSINGGKHGIDQRLLSCTQRAGDPPIAERTAPASQPVLNAARDTTADKGSHDGAWVRCRHRHAFIGVDPLGPIVAHGLHEAPAYRPGLLSAAQSRALAAGRLHLDVAAGSARVSGATLKPNRVWQRLRIPAPRIIGASGSPTTT